MKEELGNVILFCSLISSAVGVFWVVAKARKEWHDGTLKRLEIMEKKATQGKDVVVEAPTEKNSKRISPFLRRTILGFAILNLVFSFYYVLDALIQPQPVDTRSVVILCFTISYIFLVGQMYIYLNLVSKLTDINLVSNSITDVYLEKISQLADVANKQNSVMKDIVIYQKQLEDKVDAMTVTKDK